MVRWSCHPSAPSFPSAVLSRHRYQRAGRAPHQTQHSSDGIRHMLGDPVCMTSSMHARGDDSRTVEIGWCVFLEICNPYGPCWAALMIVMGYCRMQTPLCTLAPPLLPLFLSNPEWKLYFPLRLNEGVPVGSWRSCHQAPPLTPPLSQHAMMMSFTDFRFNFFS